MNSKSSLSWMLSELARRQRQSSLTQLRGLRDALEQWRLAHTELTRLGMITMSELIAAEIAAIDRAITAQGEAMATATSIIDEVNDIDERL